ncbi:1-phosphofructokinase [Chitinispirillum alkaliphilum]|nr:1-phosphofructokinase [Chitinispirillum alkaliphilum]
MIYCGLLNPAVDLCLKLDRFEMGNTLLDLPSRVVPSGKGINVARVIKALGEDVCVAALMPENDSLRFSSFLTDLGIKPLFFETPGSARINVTLSEEKSACVSHLNCSSSQVPLRVQEEFLQFISGHINKSDQWCFSGSIPSGFEKDIYARIVNICHSKGADTLVDTRGDALKHGIRARPLIIKPNITELEEYFEEPVHGVHHMALKGKRFIDMGISYVFISLGADGMIALHKNDCLLCSPPSVRAVSTVGCGDALVAGVVVALKRKFSFPEICRMAVACGASNAVHEEPGVVTRDEIWQLMEDVQVNAV